jgi:hypothetical protein
VGQLIRATAQLPPSQQQLLLAATRDKQPLSRLMLVSGYSAQVTKAELVASLRALTVAGPATRLDPGVGDLLLSEDSVTERDEFARSLMQGGVKAVDLHAVSSAFEKLRKASAKAWTSVLMDPAACLPPPPWPLEDAGDLQLLDRVVREREPRQLVVGPDNGGDGQLDHRIVAALRALAGVRGDRRTDRLIAAFLFDGPDRPRAAQLWAAGVDPLELHELDLRVRALRELPESDWAQIVRAHNGGLDSHRLLLAAN